MLLVRRHFRAPKAGEVSPFSSPVSWPRPSTTGVFASSASRRSQFGCLGGEFSEQFLPGERKLHIEPMFAPRG